MDIKIIKLITTLHDLVGCEKPIVESTIIGVVDVHEDITDLVDLYHEEYIMEKNNPYTIFALDQDAYEEKIETEVISLSTVQELVNTKLNNNRDRQNGQLKSGSQALEELKIRMNN